MVANELWKLPDSWRWVELGDISEVVSKGTTPTTLGLSFTAIGIPFLRAEDVSGGAINSNLVAFHIDRKTHNTVLARSQLKPGDLLITIAGTLGRVGYVPNDAPPLNCNQAVAFARLRPDLVDVQFACFACQHEGVTNSLVDMKKVGTIGNLNLQQVGEFRIPLPPLLEQKRIATILEKADRLRRQRHYALELSNTYLQSVFLEMFGSWDYPLYPLKKLSKDERGAFVNGPFGSNLLTSELTLSGVPVIYIRDIASGVYKRVSLVCVTEQKAKELDVCKVLPGDVLVAKVGDPPGTAVIYPEYQPTGIITQDVIRIRVNRSLVTPEYLSAFLNSRKGYHTLEPIIVEGTRARFSLTPFKELPIPVPPLTLQDDFANIVRRYNRLHAQQLEVYRQTEHLFQTLLHQAFEGDVGLGSGIGQGEALGDDVQPFVSSEPSGSFVQLQMNY